MFHHLDETLSGVFVLSVPVALPGDGLVGEGRARLPAWAGPQGGGRLIGEMSWVGQEFGRKDPDETLGTGGEQSPLWL